MSRIAPAVLPLLLLLLLPGQAMGQTAEANFGVRAMVFADCDVNVQDLLFGVYDPRVDGTGTTVIYVQCTAGTGGIISLSAGNSGNPNNRVMTGPGDLNYQLYRDIALQDPIDTIGIAFSFSGFANFGQLMPFRIYGKIPKGQNARAGAYSDMIRVTVQF